MAGVRASVQVPTDGAGKKLDSFSYDLSDGRGTNYANTAVIVDANGQAVTTIADGQGNVGLGVAPIATNFVLSTANSTVAQLAAGATFTGTLETIDNQPSISIDLTSDVPGLLTVSQYIDSGGTKVIASWPFTIMPGVPFSRCWTGNGNYFNLTFKNTGSTTSTTLNINTGFATLEPVTSLGNAPVSIEEVAGTKVNAFAAGHLNVHQDPAQLFYDPYDAALDTTNRWTAPATGNSATAAAVSSGVMSLATGTTASGWSYLQSQPTFRSSTPAWIRFAFNITLADGAAPTAHAYRYWGCGIAQAAPTTAAPIVNGAGFELATSGKMYAVVWNSGSRTAVQDLSVSTGEGTQPMDATSHNYQVYYRPTNIYYYIDGVLVATANLAQSAIAVDAMSVLYLAAGDATPPSPSAVLASNACSVSDTGPNAMSIADGTYPWRKSQVLAGGAQAVVGAPGAMRTQMAWGTAGAGVAATGSASEIVAVLAQQFRAGASVGTTGTSFAITANKTFRVTGFTVGIKNNAASTTVGFITLRYNPTGAAINTSAPSIVLPVALVATSGAVFTTGATVSDGIDLPGGATPGQFGVSYNLTYASTAPTVYAFITGYEYA